ncbi:MAG: hypothetical protein OIN85_01955 [Candidatus Methanoperedens sp.]|nr:hypothetical protein [Candidatus Methanoperedens sp.]
MFTDKRNNTEKTLADFIADILNQSPTKCLSIEEIYFKVEQRWEIPQEWHKPIPHGSAFNKLNSKGLNWKTLSDESLKSIVPTELKWKNEVRRARQRLMDRGWLEENGKRGVWCLNQNGQEGIDNYINY